MTRMPRLREAASLALCLLGAAAARADSDVYLLGVPDYAWNYGCFGTACGNLIGYWDRHGFPDFYTGPTAGGVAPLSSGGGNAGIVSLWASKAGQDGRPAGQPGHVDDYWMGYDSTSPDPYVTAQRSEHSPDCLGDFIGLSQRHWTNMNNECDGNVDGYSFVYWETRGARRNNFVPPATAGLPARDIPSGLRAWADYRGFQADTFSQLTDFNTNISASRGFSFQHLKAEIDAGYPVLLFLQDYNANFKARPPISRANPEIHGMLAYGYAEYPALGIQWVYYRTSWASGDGIYSQWTNSVWQAGMPVRGVIGFHPKPKIRSFKRQGGKLTLAWDGPASQLYDRNGGATTDLHRYQVESSTNLSAVSWTPVTAAQTNRSATVLDCCNGTVFYRVRLL